MIERRPTRVYLAGGFHTGWQREVIAGLASCEIFDPSQHQIVDPKEYTAWDLEAVRRSDVLFGYMEATNPGGYALAVEVGFAKALGKVIYLVDGTIDPSTRKYFEMVRQCADLTFTRLEDGVFALNKRLTTQEAEE